MKVNRLLDIHEDIEKEIYEDQIFHLKNGILVNKGHLQQSIVQESKLSGQAKDFVKSSLLFSSSKTSCYIRGKISLDSNVCLFPDDIVEISNENETHCLFMLKVAGSSRRDSEEKSLIFNSRAIVNDCIENLDKFLSNLTIEAFLQFDYEQLFRRLNIEDRFFQSISNDNYESLEGDFNAKVSNIVSNQNYRLNLADVYFYQKYLQIIDKKNISIDFMTESHVKLENSWSSSGRISL